MCKITISVFEFMKLFPNEDVAIQWFEQKRWGENVACPTCNNKNIVTLKTKRHFYQCRSCRLEFSVRTNTVMHRSHLPLHKWLYAMYCVVTARKGISSLQLSKELGITQKSTWFLLQRIRIACRSGDQLLGQVVEVDEPISAWKRRVQMRAKS